LINVNGFFYHISSFQGLSAPHLCIIKEHQNLIKMDTIKSMTATQLLRRSLDTFLAKDMKGWSELCAEDVVAEFPFAPEGLQKRFEGRKALYAYLKDYPTYIDVQSLPTVTIYGTDDSNIAIAEWSASGVVIGSGNPYEMSYATFVTFRDGLIVNYREYWNPQAFQKAMSGGSFAE
jgi:ketosteroid isomerase-like protein